MSVNITVNGKFTKNFRSHPLLDDPEKVRKAEEQERRKLRLLQVREECKKIAKKIRDEVNEEKKRELQKLQETKEREFECWRQHALRERNEAYRDAIFQIGTAHRAAKRENDKMKAKQKVQGSYKDFKKQIAAKKCQTDKELPKSQFVCACQETLPSTSKQFKCTCTQTDDPNTKTKAEVHKRKRGISSSSSESEGEDELSQQKTTLSLSSTSDSSLSSVIENEVTQSSISAPNKNKCLIKTPAIFVDVEVGSDDSIIIKAPAESIGESNEYDRQIKSVIRLSPRKASKQKEKTCQIQPLPQSSSTTISASDVVGEEQHDNKSSFETQDKQVKNIQAAKEKRFTIISDLVKKQQTNDISILTKQNVPSSPSKSLSSRTTTSPAKQSKEVSFRPTEQRSPAQSPRKSTATSKSSKTATTQPLTSLTSTIKGSTAASSSGRVQFYDYNNKFTKQQEKSTTMANVQRQRDESQPSAMEQAELENQREKDKQLEALKKIQIVEERGQKAMEREQIRRDCNALTEKLEALTREYANHLPTNDNYPHIYVDKQLRKEGKMNSAIEKLLQRPNVITCSEESQPVIDENRHRSSKNVGNSPNLLNVASLNSKPLPSDDLFSDSCCSILLGYVDDQSRLIKHDLQNVDTYQNQSKRKSLQDLLKRLDKLRNTLIEELENERESRTESRDNEKTKFSSRGDNLTRVIDGICEMRKEHEELIVNDKTSDQKSLSERERELQAKETLLDKKVREFYELQKQKHKPQNITVKKNLKRIVKKGNATKDQTSSSSEENNDTNKTANDNDNDNDNIICASGKNPLEIIITVRGEEKCVKKVQKPKRRHFPERSVNKFSTLMRSPQPSLLTKKKIQAKKGLDRQTVPKKINSFDSNSTSYASLPAEMPTNVEILAKQRSEYSHKEARQTVAEEQKRSEENENEISIESANSSSILKSRPRLNPLIAQYIQQLLGMSRNSVQKLSVSSSEIDTPGSSTINTTGNTTEMESLCSEERLTHLQRFIEDNKSFVKDLEKAIHLKNNASLENSWKMIDDIWRKRLKKNNTDVPKRKKEKTQTPKGAKNENNEQNFLDSADKRPNKSKNLKKPTKTTQTYGSKNLECKIISVNNVPGYSNNKEAKSSSTYKETADKAIDAKLPLDSSKTESNSQIAVYAKLTENCTNRIAELTELINRVRQEKQRLLEVTLSSVSENGRQSSEPADPREAKPSRDKATKDEITIVNSCSEESTRSRQSSSSETIHEMPKLSAADKNKQIANSYDSGIAESRPITALENRVEPEPVSHTSESTAAQEVRKTKPPPTLNRFSPQLPEDELPHELSTIFEVDTPATSRINTAIAQSTDQKENALNTTAPQPVLFPAFKEYIKNIGVDISSLRPEESLILQQEFASFLERIQQNRSSEESQKHSEFPTIDEYIKDFCKDEHLLSDTMEEYLNKLCLTSKSPQKFPSIREYIKNIASKSLSSGQQILDTSSLENTDNDTDSLDIERELRKRNILKKSFRVVENATSSQAYGSTTKMFAKGISADESGVQKLSTSTNTGNSMENELHQLIEQSRSELKRKPKSTNILSSTTTSTNPSAIANSALRAVSSEGNAKGKRNVLNLRDFLTRELEKHANNSGSPANSTSDESLRSHFLNSLIDSLTPRTGGTANKSGAPTLERYKTSTPIAVQLTQTNTITSSSNAASKIFSCESYVSSVSYDL